MSDRIASISNSIQLPRPSNRFTGSHRQLAQDVWDLVEPRLAPLASLGQLKLKPLKQFVLTTLRHFAAHRTTHYRSNLGDAWWAGHDFVMAWPSRPGAAVISRTTIIFYDEKGGSKEISTDRCNICQMVRRVYGKDDWQATALALKATPPTYPTTIQHRDRVGLLFSDAAYIPLFPVDLQLPTDEAKAIALHHSLSKHQFGTKPTLVAVGPPGKVQVFEPNQAQENPAALLLYSSLPLSLAEAYGLVMTTPCDTPFLIQPGIALWQSSVILLPHGPLIGEGLTTICLTATRIVWEGPSQGTHPWVERTNKTTGAPLDDEAFRGTISHPYITPPAPVVITWPDGKVSYMEPKMQLLSDWAKSKTLSEICLCFAKLYDALVYMRNEGVLHRDLKPENIFIDENGDPKIGDFQYALRTRDASVIVDDHKGAMLVRSPEAVHDHIFSPASEVHAIGFCLVEVVFGVDQEMLSKDILGSVGFISVVQKPFRTIFALAGVRHTRALGAFAAVDILTADDTTWPAFIEAAYPNTPNHTPLIQDLTNRAHHNRLLAFARRLVAFSPQTGPQL